jgi:hypothetical protein
MDSKAAFAGSKVQAAPRPSERYACCQYIRGQQKIHSEAEMCERTTLNRRDIHRKFGVKWRVSDTAQAKSAKSTGLMSRPELLVEQGCRQFYFRMPSNFLRPVNRQ